MIYIFGDSHADFNFRNFSMSHSNKTEMSITMHRIGRDNQIINFDSSMNDIQNTFIFLYGEVDCRCHITRQLGQGRQLDEICLTLVDQYFKTISNNCQQYKKIIICSITPPIRKKEYEDKHGPVTHEFPFLGTDAERVSYTKKMNQLLHNYCIKHNFIWVDTYPLYARDDGTLKWELSDGICHIKNNTYFLEQIMKNL